MSFHQSVSLAGFQAEVAALKNTYDALFSQNSVLRTIVQNNNSLNFLPGFLVSDARKAAFIRGIDKDIIETLILVGLVGAFQKFIKVLISDVLITARRGNASFSSIDQNFRQKYLAAAAGAYRFKPEGTVRGVRVNFTAIESSLAKCLTDDPTYTLEGEAVTSEMGNPTPKVIDEIFQKIGMSTPFNPTYGQTLIDEGWDADSSGDAIRSSKALLIKNIDRRNDAVHGMEKIVFNAREIGELCEKFGHIGKALYSSVDEQV